MTVSAAPAQSHQRAIGSWRSYGPWSSLPLQGEPPINVEALSIRYEGHAQPAVDAVSLTVTQGECVLLLGDNGAGKSSLLKALAGLLAPSEGRASIFGLPVGWCRGSVAYVPQRGELDWDFPIDVRSLVATGRHVHRGWFGRMHAADRAAIEEAIDQLGLREIARKQIGQLSGGQQQRTLVARALVQDAALLLVDEPTNSMDSASVATLASVLQSCLASGRTIVMSTHDSERFRGIGSRVIKLERGRIVQDSGRP